MTGNISIPACRLAKSFRSSRSLPLISILPYVFSTRIKFSDSKNLKVASPTAIVFLVLIF
jgi:hypothetical protein